MADSDQSYNDSCSDDSNEDSDGMTSSESDCDVKHLRYPHRNLRWPVGSPLPKNPVRGTVWNKNKGLRIESKDQQDMFRYVPGRMPKLLRKAQADIAADFKEGGNGSSKAVCHACKEKVPFSADPDEYSKELMEHIKKCWAPTNEPPMGSCDKRKKIPTVLGHFATEDDEDCLLLSVQSPGPYGGAYMMLLAFPLQMDPKPDLASLDAVLRKEWFHEDDMDVNFFPHHQSVFIKREAGGEMEEERKMYDGFEENIVTSRDKRKMTADDKFFKVSGNRYQAPGSVVWAREWKGVFWPAVVMEERESGILARRDPEDEDEIFDRFHGLQWHVVFLGREGKRLWARDNYDTFKPFDREIDVEKWQERHKKEILTLDGDEKAKWEDAVMLGKKLEDLDNEAVLKVLAKVPAMIGGERSGEEIKDSSAWKILVDFEKGEEKARKTLEDWRNYPGKHKWSFYKSVYGANYEVPFPLPVEKVPGFSYWPLMGTEKGTDEEQEVWKTFLTPDKTETSLEKIFTMPGETAIYQYHLVDGFRSRCKVTYHGKMLVRTRGKTRWLPSKEQLTRDPEYERDVQRVKKLTGKDGKPSMEDIKRIIHCPPPSDKPSILARNEPPFIPCSNCKIKTSEFCDTGMYLSLQSLEDPDVRLGGHTAVFCSAPCARAWNIETSIDLPVGDLLEMENSPRAGMCRFSRNILIKLHVIRSVNILDMELWPLKPGYGLYTENGEYIDDERAEGRHHPLWPKERRRKYRDNKRRWQDLILGRIKEFGLEVPRQIDYSTVYYD